jgi:hypothetical protein
MQHRNQYTIQRLRYSDTDGERVNAHMEMLRDAAGFNQSSDKEEHSQCQWSAAAAGTGQWSVSQMMG